MQPPLERRSQPVVGFLLGFLSLLLALSYFSTQFANKNLLQAKTLGSLAQQKLQTLSLNINHILLSARQNYFNRFGHSLHLKHLKGLNQEKYSGARTREMKVKMVQIKSQGLVISTDKRMDNAAQQKYSKPQLSPMVAGTLNYFPLGINNRTISAL